jgi:ADP-heptose:LPS heptosyltransferase
MEHPPRRSPLSGKYLVRNPLLNRLLALTDWLLAVARPASRAAPVAAPRRILLANQAHLGDVLLSLRVLAAVRRLYPGARLGYLIGSWARPLLQGHPLVDWIHVVDHWKLNRAPASLAWKLAHHQRTRRRALQEIRATGYDLAIDLYYYFPNAIPLLWQAGIPLRVGYTSGGFGPLLTHALDWADSDRPVSAYQLDLLRALGVRDAELGEAPAPWIPGDSGLPPAAREALRRGGLPLDNFLVCHSGTGSPLREWPLAHWRELVARLVRDGHALVFTGSAGAEARRAAAAMEGRPRCLNLCGRLSWPEFVGTIRQARLVVGVESVAGHLAAAVGTPCVLVFSGMTNRAHWAPRGPACRVLSLPLACAPCYRSRGCATMACVRGVGVDAVHAAVGELLAVSRRQGA